MNSEQPITETFSQNHFKNKFILKGLTTGYNKLYMYALTLILAFTGYFIYPSLLVFPLLIKAKQAGISDTEIMQNSNVLFNADKMGINRNLMLIMLFSIFIITAILFLIGLYKIHKKNILSVITGYSKFRTNKFIFGFILWSIMFITTLFIQYFISKDNFILTFNFKNFVGSLTILIFFIPLQTLWEEILFRGYGLQGLSIGLKQNLFPLVVTSLFFSIMHMSNPEVKEHGIGLMFIYYFVFAIFLGIITLLDEGLELAFGIHCANNLMIILFTTSKASVIKAYSVFEVNNSNATTDMIYTVCMLIVTFLVFRIKYKWKNYSLILK